jgi:glucose-fructose oxidoreductase
MVVSPDVVDGVWVHLIARHVGHDTAGADQVPADNPMTRNDDTPALRYAVIGAGHITQAAVLPAFAQAENAELVALFSSDDVKRKELAEKYDLEHVYDYDDYDQFLGKGLVDAVYIALPNHLHCEYTVRAARNGVHVLCEKPMAVDETECEQMMRAAGDAGLELMIAYRLHFEPAHLEAIEVVRSGDLGNVRFFDSSFSQDVQPGNVRLEPVSRGGGPVYDMGVYCIDAARYLFRDEPTQVSAVAASRDDDRFVASPETVAATMTFPQARLASFVVSFGSSDTSRFEVVGDKGRLIMEPAYEYDTRLRYIVEAEARRERTFEKYDQFAAQLWYFGECVAAGRSPEPGALDGIADVHITRCIHQSLQTGKSVRLLPIRQDRRPDLSQRIVRPGIEKPEEVHTQSASGPEGSRLVS